MKRILFVLLMILPYVAYGQRDVPTFLGIPLSGDTSIIRKTLVAEKGFVLMEKNLLKGCVDGDSCLVVIEPVAEDRIKVSAIDLIRTKDYLKAIDRYNTLLDFYKSNQEYTEFEPNPYINGGQDVNHASYIKNAWYYAEFFQVCFPQYYTRRLSLTIIEDNNEYLIVRSYDTSPKLSVYEE